MVFDVASLGGNLALIDEQYELYRRDPDAVEPGFRALFETGQLPAPPAALPGNASVRSVWPLVNAYRVRGHLAAALDPLEMLGRRDAAALDSTTYGLTEDDLDQVFDTGGVHGLPPVAPLSQIVSVLERAYCGTIGLEFMHITPPARKQWLWEHMESLPAVGAPPRDVRLQMLRKLIEAETFESFIHTKYPGTKRFSLEGGETLVPMLEETIEHLGRLGAIEIVIGMAHRGRLNVLVQSLGREPRDLFSEFDDVQPELTLGAGDVKYHLGFSADRVTRSGHPVHLSLAYNPSHLEAVDPVVVGRVRAKQRRHGDWERRRAAGILIHGDAAFAGQGLVAETLQLSNLHGYRTGGTVHLIVNNQIGFTATAAEYRSTPYCTDIARMLQCPIWHVNGEDPDAVAHVCKMAMEYRARYQSDVVIDMFCYRKYGHNEMDEPSFTQPAMYERIQAKKPIAALYAERLITDGVLEEGDVAAMRAEAKDHFELELKASRERQQRPIIPAMGGVWSQYVGGRDVDTPDVDTAVARERLEEIAVAMTTVPDGIRPHRKVTALLESRLSMGRGEERVDWGMGEMLAYGSLLWDGHMVRLSGQDSARGTFSHRHGLIVDMETATEYMLLGHLHKDQGECRIYDSPLSEAGVLGFEFGYSLDYPDGLILWEAQFGDFANGAQVIIDQFIVSSEDKWNRLSGLVMLLPHGFEGQGPEHSSARIERFLQACAEDNIQVCQPTTPAQMFHLLRRQVVRKYRKPLIVATPKSLLRLPRATSAIDELATGAFRRFLGDDSVDPAATRRVFLCSGRLYYDLVREREEREDDSAILRVEQFYPWRGEQLGELIAAFPDDAEVVWVQDEPANMGALGFLEPRLRPLLGRRRYRVVSREESASPATGSTKAHAIEQKALLESAFSGQSERK